VEAECFLQKKEEKSIAVKARKIRTSRLAPPLLRRESRG
jgi:hypothetical protein